MTNFQNLTHLSQQTDANFIEPRVSSCIASSLDIRQPFLPSSPPPSPPTAYMQWTPERRLREVNSSNYVNRVAGVSARRYRPIKTRLFLQKHKNKEHAIKPHIFTLRCCTTHCYTTLHALNQGFKTKIKRIGPS